ncbi:unnamed protein product [Peniophora sp. CBMAI 1063]|nr:unnamed protein product [Peniophora sp. CBMAI 1063]
MQKNDAAANAFGIIGTLCWTLQLLPQIWKSYREKSTKGLSANLVLLWGLVGIPLGIYNTIQGNGVILVVQPQVFGVLCIISWAQCQYYDRRRSVAWCAWALAIIFALFVGLEAGIIFALRPPYERGERSADIALRFFSVLASVMLALALVDQYVEIWRHRAVVGVSLAFIFVDMMGGVFCDLSLAFQGQFDPWAGVAYTLVTVMDAVVLIAAMILNPRARRRKRRQQDADAERRSGSISLSDNTAAQEARGKEPTVTPMEGTDEKDRVQPESA